MTAVLELREVSKVYGTGPAEVDALRRVSLSVGGGELVAVMGPSGSGKSTLLTIAGSLEEPTGGQVLVAGNNLSGFSPNDQAKLRRRLIGYVFQGFQPARRAHRGRECHAAAGTGRRRDQGRAPGRDEAPGGAGRC